MQALQSEHDGVNERQVAALEEARSVATQSLNDEHQAAIVALREESQAALEQVRSLRQGKLTFADAAN